MEQLIGTASLIKKMDELLLAYLPTLQPEDWELQTVASQWKVRDVVAHLLDGNIRSISMLGDGYFGEQPKPKEHLVDFLNRLNADWVKAMKRVSPAMLIQLHQLTGPLYCDLMARLDPDAPSLFAVDWAGEKESKNWMHIAREYTEKWLHQQQIRDATGDKCLLERAYFEPFINTFMLAMPHTLTSSGMHTVNALKVAIDGNSPMIWYLARDGKAWKFVEHAELPDTEIRLPHTIAWKLFSKSIRPKEVAQSIKIVGNQDLAQAALNMVSVMA